DTACRSLVAAQRNGIGPGRARRRRSASRRSPLLSRQTGKARRDIQSRSQWAGDRVDAERHQFGMVVAQSVFALYIRGFDFAEVGMRIVAATDLSVRSQRAVRRAGLLARDKGAELILLHVVDDDQPARLVDTASREAQEYLQESRDSIAELHDL